MGEFEKIKELVEIFRNSWNSNDLGHLKTLIGHDIICKHPSIYVGLINILRGEYYGRFSVLKYWAKLFKLFDVTVEPIDIISISLIQNQYEVQCLGHFPHLGFSARFFVRIDKNRILKHLAFTRVMDYHGNTQISNFQIVAKYFRRKLTRKLNDTV